MRVAGSSGSYGALQSWSIHTRLPQPHTVTQTRTVTHLAPVGCPCGVPELDRVVFEERPQVQLVVPLPWINLMQERAEVVGASDGANDPTHVLYVCVCIGVTFLGVCILSILSILGILSVCIGVIFMMST